MKLRITKCADDGTNEQQLHGDRCVLMVFDTAEQGEYLQGYVDGEFEAPDLVNIIESLHDLFGNEMFVDALGEAMINILHRSDSDNEGENMTETYNRQAAIEAQEKYCSDHGIPRFAPRDGYCSACTRNIYGITPDGNMRGYSVEYASKNHITYCPFCHRSYDD